MRYEPMTIKAYQEVYALWASVPGVGLSEADSRDNIAAYLARNPGQSFICRDGGRVVGTILCGNDGRRAFIHHTAVEPEYRGRGIGKALVDMALDKQKQLGIGKCHLLIFAENESGKAFWEKTGFAARTDIGIMSKVL